MQGLPVLKFQTIEDASSIDVDMFLAETAYQRELIARRCRYTAEGWSAWFVSPEDLILLKLIADRPKDRVDVADVLFVQGRVDENYLRLWAERLKIADRLTTALESSQE